jgi:hypothetical protein
MRTSADPAARMAAAALPACSCGGLLKQQVGGVTRREGG